MPGVGLSPQQEKFAQSVASGMNLSDAYRAAYATANMTPGSVNNRASQLMAQREITVRVKELNTLAVLRSGLKTVEVLEEVRRVAHSDIAGIMHPDGKVKLPHELDPATRAAVKGFKIDEYGRVEYQFWDKNAALDKAMKHLGLYDTDNKQKNPPIAATLTVAFKGTTDDGDR